MDPGIIRFRSLLKNEGHFATQPRLKLFATLQNHSTLSIHELITSLERHNQATVYRNIKLFEELGIISRLQLGWRSKLELSDVFQHHHHHMTCGNCGKVYILKDNPIIEAEIDRMSRTSGFKSTDHQLEIRGLCKTCTKVVI